MKQFTPSAEQSLALSTSKAAATHKHFLGGPRRPHPHGWPAHRDALLPDRVPCFLSGPEGSGLVPKKVTCGWPSSALAAAGTRVPHRRGPARIEVLPVLKSGASI